MFPLFVYGSLKEGYPNFHFNKGVRLPGEYVTVEPYPFYLAHGQLPCLLPLRGEGLRVKGQLFKVDEDSLALMDRLEKVGEPGGYSRRVIEVVVAEALTLPATSAFVYMQSPAFLTASGSHEGPIAEYTLEHAQSLRW